MSQYRVLYRADVWVTVDIADDDQDNPTSVSNDDPDYSADSVSEIHINDEDIGTPVLYLDDETGLALADDEDRLRTRIDEALASTWPSWEFDW